MHSNLLGAHIFIIRQTLNKSLNLSESKVIPLKNGFKDISLYPAPLTLYSILRNHELTYVKAL